MINVQPFVKWMTLSLCGVALCFSLLKPQEAPPLPEPAPYQSSLSVPFDTPSLPLNDLLQLTLTARGGDWSPYDDQVLSPRETAIFTKMNSRRGEPLMTQEEFLQVLYTPSAIQPAANDESQAQPSINFQGEVREIVQFSREKLETLFKGDEMYIFSKTLGDRFVVVIDRVQDHQDGTLTWIGHLKNLPGRYQISFTQGRQFTLADMETPAGNFVLEVKGRHGWLIEKQEADYELYQTAGHIPRSPLLSSAIH